MQVHLLHNFEDYCRVAHAYPVECVVVEQYIPGKAESCMQAVVVDGKIQAHFEYTEYADAEEYIWPRVRICDRCFITLTHSQLLTFEQIFCGYSGFVTVNFKIKNEQPIVFDINTRMGNDLPTFTSDQVEALFTVFLANAT